MFAVVEFIEEGAVDIVCESWLTDVKGKHGSCYYPPKDMKLRRNRGEIPDKELWKKHKVKVYSYPDNLEDANEHAARAMFTSNVESEGEGAKRHCKKPQRFQEDGDSDSFAADDEDDETSRKSGQDVRFKVTPVPKPPVYKTKQADAVKPPPKKRPAQTHKEFNKKTEVLKSGEHAGCSSWTRQSVDQLDEEEESGSKSPAFGTSCRVIQAEADNSYDGDRIPPIPRTSTPVRRRDDGGRTEGSLPRQEADKYFQQAVLRKLDQIIENQNDGLIMMRKVTSLLDCGQDQDFEDVVPTKMNQTEEVEELCQRLEAPEFRKKMVMFLTFLGGNSCGESVRRMLRKLGTNELWSKYSLKGRKGKKNFEELVLKRVIIRACKKIHPKIPVDDFSTAIMDTLKFAPSRPGGPKYKPSAKVQVTVRDEAYEDSE